MIDNPRIPPPSVCTHPRSAWSAYGSSSWSYGHADGWNKRKVTSTHETIGWYCACGAWIPNEGHKPEVHESIIDDPGLTVRW